jgi:hypothetical protein
METRVEPKAVIKYHFKPEKYTISSAIEEIESWDIRDLKSLIFELGQSQKGLNKSLMKNIIRDFILYSFDVKSFDDLISNPFVINTSILNV